MTELFRRMRWPNIGHRHYFRDQRSPPSEMLSSLTFACVCIILFPGETRLLPRREYRAHDVLPEVRVHLSRFLLMRARLLSKFLDVKSAIRGPMSRRSR